MPVTIFLIFRHQRFKAPPTLNCGPGKLGCCCGCWAGALLHPVVGVVHSYHAAHAVVLLGGGPVVALGDRGQVARPVVLISDHGVVGVGDGGLVAVAVIVVLDHIALVVGDLFQMAEQIVLKAVDADLAVVPSRRLPWES